MWRFISLLVVFALILTQSAFAAKQDTSGWADITGDYQGHATVRGTSGDSLFTKVLINIRKGKGKFYIIEMAYFTDKIAKFTKCARIGENRISIQDNVIVENRVFKIHGSLRSKDGKVFEGKLRYERMFEDGRSQVYREFRLSNIKKIVK